MKKSIFYAALLIAGTILFGCNSKKHTAVGSNGYFGNLLSIKENYAYDDSVLSVKAQTEIKSMDEAIAMQSKKNKLETDAKEDFSKEVAKTTLPINVPFVDSSDGKDYTVKEVKITKITWNGATIEATVELKQNTEKITGSIYTSFVIAGELLNDKNTIINYKNGNAIWAVFIKDDYKQAKAGEIITVKYNLLMNKVYAADFKKITFKSYGDYKKIKWL
jgi:hypothetical protein